MRLVLAAFALCTLFAAGCSDDEDGGGTGASGGSASNTSGSGAATGSGASGGDASGPGGAGVGGAGGEGGGQGGGAAMMLTSTAFAEGMPIPEQYVCEGGGGDNISPPLSWTAGPAGTQSYAVVMRDLDYMNGFLHWVIWDIPATVTSLPEGVEGVFEPSDPAGAKQANFGAGVVGYFGPCSPSSINTYQFTVYAIGEATLPGLDQQSSIEEAADAVVAAEIASTTLSGES